MTSPEASRAQLLELADRLVRSWWTIVAGICVGLAAGLVGLNHTPPVYEASTSVFVASGALRGDSGEEIERSLGMRLATLRESMTGGPSGIAPELLDRADIRIGRSAFEIRFADRDPARARDTADLLARRYVEADQARSGGEVRERVRLLEELAGRLQGEIEAKRQRIAEYRAAHADETEDARAANLRLLEARRAELAAETERLMAARIRLEEIDALSIDHDAITGVPAPTAGSGELEIAADPDVARLEAELDALRERYVDRHPDVQAQLRKLERARRRAAAPDRVARPGALRLSDSMINQGRRDDDPVEGRRAGLAREVAGIEARVAATRREIARYERRLAVTPQVEQRLAELGDGLRVLRGQYEQQLAQLEAARSSELVHQADQAAGFEILEPAELPTAPVHPSVPVFLGGGLVLGLLLFVGTVVAREWLHPVVRSSAGLEQLDDLPILTAIPRVETPVTVRRRRLGHARNFGLSLASLALLAATVLLDL